MSNYEKRAKSKLWALGLEKPLRNFETQLDKYISGILVKLDLDIHVHAHVV